MPLSTVPLQQPNQPIHSLKYSANIPPNPQANLSGWFDRQKALWSVRRWLQLHGSMLFYSHTRHSSPQWSVDLRECQVVGGKRARELAITRPDGTVINLFAPTIEEFKLWFTELKRVSDVSHVKMNWSIYDKPPIPYTDMCFLVHTEHIRLL